MLRIATTIWFTWLHTLVALFACFFSTSSMVPALFSFSHFGEATETAMKKAKKKSMERPNHANHPSVGSKGVLGMKRWRRNPDRVVSKRR